MLDLASISGEKFEKLVEAIFRAKAVRPPLENQPSTSHVAAEFFNPTVTSVFPSGRGPDEGRDLLVTTQVNDGIAQRHFRWLVQCKHYAKSGKSVQLSDFRDDHSFVDVVSQHSANGYLLVCSTTPSTNLQKRFETLTVQEKNSYLFIIWDATRVCEEVNRHLDVMRNFFPKHYNRYYQNQIEIKDIMRWAREKGVPEETLDNLTMALSKVTGPDEEPKGRGVAGRKKR